MTLSGPSNKSEDVGAIFDQMKEDERRDDELRADDINPPDFGTSPGMFDAPGVAAHRWLERQEKLRKERGGG